MAGRRIVYGVALLAALAFQIFYDGYLTQFLLVCLLALPVLSLLLSLPILAGLRLALAPSGPRLVQGQAGHWRLTARSSLPLPVARLALRLTFHNALTGATADQRLQLAGLAGGQTRPLPLEGDHCGALTCRVSRARALDFLGLFSLPIHRPDPAHRRRGGAYLQPELQGPRRQRFRKNLPCQSGNRRCHGNRGYLCHCGGNPGRRCGDSEPHSGAGTLHRG